MWAELLSFLEALGKNLPTSLFKLLLEFCSLGLQGWGPVCLTALSQGLPFTPKGLSSGLIGGSYTHYKQQHFKPSSHSESLWFPLLSPILPRVFDSNQRIFSALKGLWNYIGPTWIIHVHNLSCRCKILFVIQESIFTGSRDQGLDIFWGPFCLLHIAYQFCSSPLSPLQRNSYFWW